jgi:dethiobiotin synthetase
MARAWRAAGGTLAVRKPAETGCEMRGTELHPADAAALRDAAGAAESLEDVCALRLPDPLAPAVAAERAGVRLDLPRLVLDYRARAASVDLLLVEGAGGLLVPLDGRYTYADLARDLGAQLVLVVGVRLGAINHALLTLEVARARALPVVGWIANHFASDDSLAARTLSATLCQLTDAPMLAEVGHGADAAALSGWLRDG